MVTPERAAQVVAMMEVPTIALGLVCLSDAPLHSAPQKFGVTETPAQEIFAFIRDRTSTDALVATQDTEVSISLRSAPPSVLRLSRI